MIKKLFLQPQVGKKQLSSYTFLTSKRIITPEKNKKKKNRISYDLNASNLIVNRKFLSVEVVFTHLKNAIKVKLNSDDATKNFANELENIFGIPEKIIPQKKEKAPKAIKLKTR
ncbi:hypothetical protein [Lysinibacillus sp. GbtcB16]|uniref:hypothetical protein n=1 Tax=Lysinibacillus sp. GbtcB16 TaxID=2824761 RepID=UPI001C30E6E2|nr:hypothetical protein [Lysinibacillus sp. GbtcB16]